MIGLVSIGLLLESFNPDQPRGFHGRWIGKPGGKVLRVFHGSTHLGDVEQRMGLSKFARENPRIGDQYKRTHLMLGVGRVVGEAGKTISTKDIGTLIDKAEGSPEPSARVIPKGGNANELRGGIQYAKDALSRGQRPAGGGKIVRAAAAARAERSEIERKTGRPAGEPAPEPPASRHGGFEVGDKVIYQNPYGIDKHPGEVVALHRNGNLHVREPKFGTTVDVHHTKVTPITSSQFEVMKMKESEARPDVLGALLERDFSQDKRDELAKKGHALKVGGKVVFPIETAQDAQNAKTLYLSGHHKTPAAKAHIIRNAKRVGATDVVQALQGDSDGDNDGD